MRSPLFSRFEAEILRLYAPPRRRLSTWYKMRRVLYEYSRLPSIKRVNDVTPMAILDWLDAHSDRAAITNKSYLSSFRAAITIAKKMGYLKVSPWDIRTDWIAFDFDEEDEPDVPRHLTLDQLDGMLAQADAESILGGWKAMRLQALVYTYINTGLRKMEALGLKVSDVHFGEGIIQVRSRRRRKLKTRPSARRVGISDDLAVVLRRWMEVVDSEWLFPGLRKTKPWTSGTQGTKPLDEVKALAERAGIPYATIQMLRRSIATHAKVLGLGPLEVQDLLGHGSVRTQDWYLEEDLDGILSVARRIRFRRPSGLLVPAHVPMN